MVVITQSTQGTKRLCVFFFLKGKWERWKGEKRTKKLNTAFSKIQNNHCSVGTRQSDKAESMEK